MRLIRLHYYYYYHYYYNFIVTGAYLDEKHDLILTGMKIVLGDPSNKVSARSSMVKANKANPYWIKVKFHYDPIDRLR